MTNRAYSYGRVVSILVAAACAAATGTWVVPLVLAQADPSAPPANQRAATLGELAEPPLEIVLNVDGHAHDAKLDQPFQIRLGDRDVTSNRQAVQNFPCGRIGVSVSAGVLLRDRSHRPGHGDLDTRRH